MIYDWHIVKSYTTTTLDENKPTQVFVNDKAVCVLKQGEKVYAFAATCPHAGARFCDGWVDVQQRVVCPEHKYRFDPANGRNTSGEGYKLKTYPVEIRDEQIVIGLW